MLSACRVHPLASPMVLAGPHCLGHIIGRLTTWAYPAQNHGGGSAFPNPRNTWRYVLRVPLMPPWKGDEVRTPVPLPPPPPPHGWGHTHTHTRVSP